MSSGLSEYVNSVFEQPWWLDTVAPEKWKEILVKEEGRIIARWPIVEMGWGIGMPKLTQTLGFWLDDKVLKSDKYLYERKRITNLLLHQVYKYKNIKVTLDHNVNYFLPMYWDDFVIQPCISYRIIDLSDLEQIYDRFSKNVKRNINTARRKVDIKTIDNIEFLIQLLEKTFNKQNRKLPISKDLVRNIYISSKENQSSRLLYALNREGNVISGCLFIFDKNVCYYLLPGNDPKYSNTGANALLIWEGIRFASTVSKSFDFEGSMIEGIENYFQQFGGTPIVYYQIRKQSIILELFELLKPKLKSYIGYKR